jgi:farnesyl diphosphate synthase
MLAAKPLPLQQALAQTSLAVDAYVKAALAEFDLPVARAMSYAVEGGKSLRGFLVLETARLHGIGGGAAISAAAAIECLHAYSLIHDDLPCMDDDHLRRGRPTVHRKWDEATAVLAGDALQSLAFELVLETECSAARFSAKSCQGGRRCRNGRRASNGYCR